MQASLFLAIEASHLEHHELPNRVINVFWEQKGVRFVGKPDFRISDIQKTQQDPRQPPPRFGNAHISAQGLRHQLPQLLQAPVQTLQAALQLLAELTISGRILRDWWVPEVEDSPFLRPTQD